MEKDLLQARVKAINNILDQVNRQIQECRAKLASIILAERLVECQDFINKVSELRFTKVKQRQINKLNQLVSKKEGNVALANAVNNITNPINRQASRNSHNPTPANALLPPGEGSNPLPATVHLSLEGNSLPNSQANNNNITNIIGNSANSQANNNNITNIIGNSANSQTQSPNNTPAIAHLPPGEGSNSLPGAVHLPTEDDSSSQQTVFTPTREENNSSQTTPPPISNSPQSSRSPQAGQGNNLPRAGRQGNRHPHRPHPTQPSQEACTTSLGRQPYLHTPQQGQPRFFKGRT